jgi:hypothetical protein
MATTTAINRPYARNYSGPIDNDSIFDTYADLVSYCSGFYAYAGQIVAVTSDSDSTKNCAYRLVGYAKNLTPVKITDASNETNISADKNYVILTEVEYAALSTKEDDKIYFIVEDESDPITTKATKLSFSSDSDDGTLTVYSKSKVSVTERPSWLSLSLNETETSDSTKVYDYMVSENTSSTSRSGNLILTNASGNSITIPVTQAAEGKVSISVNNDPIAATTTSITGKVLTNVSSNEFELEAYIEESSEDLTVSYTPTSFEASDETSVSFTVTVPKNTTGSARTIVIHAFSNTSDADAEYRVTQEA